MRHRITKGRVNYWPNRFEHNPPQLPHEGGNKEFPQKVSGIKTRQRGAKFNEHHSQAQLFFNSLTDIEKAHLLSAVSFELDHCDDLSVPEMAVKRFVDIDFELAVQIAKNVGGPVPEKPGRENHGRYSKPLSQTYYMPETPTIKSRRIAILVADGFDMGLVRAMQGALKAAGALPFVIGPRRGRVFPSGSAGNSGDEGILADHHYEGMRSTLFDALLIPSGAECAKSLAKNGRAIHWVREAFGHLKAIGAVGEGVTFIRDAVQLPGVKFAPTSADSSSVISDYGVVTVGALRLESITETLRIARDAVGFAEKFAFEVSQHKNWDRETDGLAAMVAF